MAAALLVLLASCGGSPSEPSAVFRELQPSGGTGATVCEPGVRVARSAAEWAAFGLTFEQPPAINFAGEMAVILATGARGSSGYSVEVRGVRRSVTGLVVEAVELTPGRCVVLPVVTCPFAVIVVTRTERPVDVVWSAVRARPGCE